MKGLITVIIPAHNNADRIGVALESIINQTYANLEIIVVDDNSKDNTKEVIMEFCSRDSRVKYLALTTDDPNRIDPKLKRNINAGYAARNLGLSKASGELITFQDADDASLLNRIEIQYSLINKHKATHVCTDWIPFSQEFLSKKFLIDEYMQTYANKDQTEKIIGPEELYKISQKTKGLVAKISPWLNSIIPFRIKRLRLINRIFFGSLDSYPGAGNSPLFRREVIEKVQFRKLANRVWPSFMGRGADRDFNFQVAETFRNSYIFPIPMYMWHTKSQSDSIYKDISNFIR